MHHQESTSIVRALGERFIALLFELDLLTGDPVLTVHNLTRAAITLIGIGWALSIAWAAGTGSQFPLPLVKLSAEAGSPQALIYALAAIAMVTILVIIARALTTLAIGTLFTLEDPHLRGMMIGSSWIAAVFIGVVITPLTIPRNSPMAILTIDLPISYITLFTLLRTAHILRNPIARRDLWAALQPFGTATQFSTPHGHLIDISRPSLHSTRLLTLTWIIGTLGNALLLHYCFAATGSAWQLGCLLYVACLFATTTALDLTKSNLLPQREHSPTKTNARAMLISNTSMAAILGLGLVLLTWSMIATQSASAQDEAAAPIFDLDFSPTHLLGKMLPSLPGGAWFLGLILIISARSAGRSAHARWGTPRTHIALDSTKGDCLYLRSFRDDSISLEGDPRTSTLESLHFASIVHFEELLAHTFRTIGDVRAIAEPGSPVGRFGASKEFYSDRKWQAAASEMISRAKVIALVAGRTRGLEWEFHQILESGAISKTVILFPPVTRESLAQRWASVATLTHLPAWNSISWGNLLPILAFFTESGGLTIIASSSQNAAAYRIATKRATTVIADEKRTTNAIPLTQRNHEWTPDSNDAASLELDAYQDQALVVGELSEMFLDLGGHILGYIGVQNDRWTRFEAMKYFKSGGGFEITQAAYDSAKIARFLRRSRADELPSAWRAAQKKIFAKQHLSRDKVEGIISGGWCLMSESGEGALFGLLLARKMTEQEYLFCTDEATKDVSMGIAIDWIFTHPLLKHTTIRDELLESVLIRASLEGCHTVMARAYRDASETTECLVEAGFEVLWGSVSDEGAGAEEHRTWLKRL